MQTKSKPTATQKVGNAIAKYRKAAGLSQAKVAELMGLSNDAISRMERGTITLNIDRLFEFAELFGCEPTDLLTSTSTKLTDQTLYLAKLLSKLNVNDRKKLLTLVEQMIDWKIDTVTELD